MNQKPETPADASQENKMGVMPMDRLILNMSLPIMISMLAQAFYNVVDSIFVSMISENALTAVSLAFPLQSLMIAVATGTGVGINALLSRSLGEKNFARARTTAVNGIFLALLSFLAFLLIGFLAVPAFYRSQTDVGEIVNYGVQYLTICCCVSPGLFGEIVFERLLQSTGRTVYTMGTASSGTSDSGVSSSAISSVAGVSTGAAAAGTALRGTSVSAMSAFAAVSLLVSAALESLVLLSDAVSEEVLPALGTDGVSGEAGVVEAAGVTTGAATKVQTPTYVTEEPPIT